MKQFYELPENLEKLHSLIDECVKDEWTNKDIEDYFYSLGYDIFFVHSKVRKYLETKH